MNVAGINNALMGMALFDMWDAAVQKSHQTNQTQGDPLIAAADQAFRQYIQSAEIGFAAQIAGVVTYALNPGGNSTHPVTTQDIAPFLALNLMA